MLGYCGIDCAECTAYKGTIGSKIELLERAAGKYQNGAYSAAEWVCLGCTPADQPFLAKYCAGCEIRVCAIAKRVPNCAACAEYDSCREIKDFMEGGELAQRMDWLHARFQALRSERGAAPKKTS
jgi:hypothetical protein